ncbi:putative cell division protein [Enterobacter cancerogenus]|uniref:Putative cell division protein n=1 Tax=Enterobacter cancerogenus TaxID=69218 RepID=A0A484Z5C6_9ENTR|nr:putative cell division protein [Enterobacter cancerogenus]
MMPIWPITRKACSTCSRHAGINLLWRDNDGGCKGACDRVPHTDMTQWKLDTFCKDQSCIDDRQPLPS